MNILLIDDEKTALRDLEKVVRRALPHAMIRCAESGTEALDIVEKNPVDIAFLDIQMPDMTGLALAEKLTARREEINLIMVTGYSEYVMDAMKLYVSDYIMKPARLEDVCRALEHLRHPVKEGKSLQVHCFGDFDVFCKGEPVRFGRSKSKELLAFLVDRRGAAVNTRRICAALWEDDLGEKTRSYFRKVLSDLRKSLRNLDAEDVLICSRDSFAVDPARIDCDYYQLLDGEPAVRKNFRGEYMSQYSWAEVTLGYLTHRKNG